jgi:hypothetical protein
MDHLKMNHDSHHSMHHGSNPPMGMAGHDHHAMIADLGLAVPLVVAKSTALSAKNGLLIKNRTAFENSRKITTIIFDKTGTLTVGKFEVSKIISLKKELSENEIIRLASALEQKCGKKGQPTTKCKINGGVWCEFVVWFFKKRLVSWDSDALRIPATAYEQTL